MLDQYIRLDVTLYPGSSGGVVINTQGEALGVAKSGLSRLAAGCTGFTVNRVVE